MADVFAGSEPRRLSDFLRERCEEILAHWEREVRKVRAARDLDRPLLLDHLPQFLEELAEYVADVRAGHEIGLPQRNPQIHALERLELGYDLSEVVVEYAILRRCITDLAVQSGAPSIKSHELPRLHAAIDQAIATSVVRYTEARERTLRALDRISNAALFHHDVDSLLPTTLAVFLETTASVDSIALALREDGAFRVRAAVGYPDAAPSGTVVPGGLATRVLEAAAPIFIRDACADSAGGHDPLCAPGTHALYGVPLILGEQVLGVAVMGSRSSYEFSQEDQFLFRTMVHRLALLIAQARLDAEVARRAAELEAVIESIPEAIYVGDASGIKRANRAALDMLGYSEMAEMNRDVGTLARELQVRAPDGTPVPIEEQVFVQALRGKRRVQEVIVRHRATGADVVVRSSGAPIRLGERVLGAVVVNTDITARKHEEEELRAALEFRDRMFGVLSHDLRNPLSVMMTSAALLQRKLDEQTQRNVLRRLVANGERIDRMIHDLLDYTRTRQGRRLPIARRETDLLELCTQVIDGMQTLYPDRPLKLAAQGETRGRFDPERAAQVISNLLANALRYGPAGSPVDVRLRGEDGSVVLEVHNLGPPIPQELQPRLFEAFQRGVAGESGRRTGLGLGLYIVQQIVDAHGGSVQVRSLPAEGTTFTVRWPRSPTGG